MSADAHPQASDELELRVNGVDHAIADVPLSTSLLDLLREHLDLRATKDACRQGRCGSCSVLMDGELVASCLVLAADAVDADITTVEGLADDPDSQTFRTALLSAGGVQCGFCTPGIVVAAHACLRDHAAAGEREVREELSGNICRCTGYGRIAAAVAQVIGGQAGDG